MIGGVTRHMLPYLSRVPRLHVNGPYVEGCKLQIFVPLRVFGTESHYICPLRYRLWLCLKKLSKNAVMSVLVWSPLSVSLNLSLTNIGLRQRFNFNFSTSIPVTFTWEPPSPRVPDNRCSGR